MDPLSQSTGATRLGILSDSHGAAGRTRWAVEALQDAGASVFVHCGDFESLDCIDPLAGLDSHIVFGNNDDAAALGAYARGLGISVHHPCGELLVDGIALAFTHGHIARAVDGVIERGVPWLFLGHSHVAADSRVHGTRLVNPGALSRATPYSVALVTPGEGIVRLLQVPSGGDRRR